MQTDTEANMQLNIQPPPPPRKKGPLAHYSPVKLEGRMQVNHGEASIVPGLLWAVAACAVLAPIFIAPSRGLGVMLSVGAAGAIIAGLVLVRRRTGL